MNATAPLDLAIDAFAALRDAGTPHLLLDCREPWEWELVRLPEAVLIPLGQLKDHLDELPSDRPVIVYCHHGVRSRHGAALVRASGREAFSLRGGIDLYACTADTSLPRY